MRTKKTKVYPTDIECTSNPIWKNRVSKLLDIIDTPMTTQNIEKKALQIYQWKSTLTDHVLAYGDGSSFFFSETKGFSIHKDPYAKEIKTKTIGVWFSKPIYSQFTIKNGEIEV